MKRRAFAINIVLVCLSALSPVASAEEMGVAIRKLNFTDARIETLKVSKENNEILVRGRINRARRQISVVPAYLELVVYAADGKEINRHQTYYQPRIINRKPQRTSKFGFRINENLKPGSYMDLVFKPGSIGESIR